MRVVKLHSSDANERELLKRRINEAVESIDVVVTTYEMAKSPNMQSAFSKLWWRYLVLDEGHIIKNEESQISIAARKFHFQNALLLTGFNLTNCMLTQCCGWFEGGDAGTPLQNNLHELWALLNFLYPEVFQSSVAFDECFNLSHGKVDAEMLTKAHHLLRPLMLRRIKSEVEKKLPPKLETKVMC